MRLTHFAPIALFCAILPAIGQAQSDHSVGVPRYKAAAPATWRFLYGMGGNLGQMNEAPSSSVWRLTHESGDFFYGIGEVNSVGSGPSYLQASVSEFDLLVGYSWDQMLPVNQGPPGTIHYAFAAGIAINDNTHLESEYDNYGYGSEYHSYEIPVSVAGVGFPMQFSMVYEPFKFLGIGAIGFLNLSNFTPSYGAAVLLEARY
ncbi:MAG TPA: hypothetical protein VFX22_05665 [Candidatus Kapabacteria bacterium]|jgi:hypothetical protein|nr:hypothetical protein [Candidatus Kapabacteria bacterium]